MAGGFHILPRGYHLVAQMELMVLGSGPANGVKISPL